LILRDPQDGDGDMKLGERGRRRFPRDRDFAALNTGRRFYIYAAKAKARLPIWSEDLAVGKPPDFDELRRVARMIERPQRKTI
jgi:hypothetical protein